MFRGDRRTYATDSTALAIAEDAVADGYHQVFQAAHEPLLFILPFTHAEDLAAQGALGGVQQRNWATRRVLKWARHHRDIIARFGALSPPQPRSSGGRIRLRRRRS